ncbi:hypothetical protein D9619_009943 [Psilocybe cf. subviscida]|uniref:Uncharacterized protein n=1 Tax=Psilocybe cf. subviscida TaxID=2480587 RepID=A0A8H5F6I3_9AGAR|nr:hypothetical protein D9619_009943 [Psilocybe cf. subviscida]
MDQRRNDSEVTPSNQRAARRRQHRASPVAMPRGLTRNQDAELDVVDVCFEVISTIAVVAANGAVLLIIGNALLRYNYTDLASAAKIGGAGGIVAAPMITVLLGILRTLPANNIANLLIGFLSDLSDIALGAMSGYFGMVLLNCFGANVHGDIDAVGAAWAGALGGVIGVWRRGFDTVLVQE